jgi:CBS-domain-containing membrane protein
MPCVDNQDPADISCRGAGDLRISRFDLNEALLTKNKSYAPIENEWKETIMDKPLLSLTAADLMSRNLVLVPQNMSLQGAARLISRAHVSGAPVVNDEGRCVGVLSTTDFLHWVENGNTRHKPEEGVWHSWQIFEKEASPTDTVGCFMTADPVNVAAGTSIGDLAQMMLDARIHRVIVVDHNERPIGIVSSTDVLAAVARETRSKEDAHKAVVDHELAVYG